MKRHSDKTPSGRGRRRLLRGALFALVFVILCGLAFARAGGAGGSSHSSSGSSFSFGGGGGYSGSGSSSGADLFFLVIIFETIGRVISFLFITLGPIPSLIILAVLVTMIVLLRRKKRHDTGNAFENLFRNPAPDTTLPASGMRDFLKRNPGFDEREFTTKVSTAFLAVQEAWSVQSLAGVRRFISDGVYQRFTTQFLMMGVLKQQNKLSGVKIENMRIDRAESDGPYDILHVGIRARMHDEFRCELNPAFNEDGDDPFTEYWSFIRKGRKDAGASAAAPGTEYESKGPYTDIYQKETCPSCGSPLPKDLGERGQCPYCSTLVNSGEYDWVLSEITQADDYAADRAVAKSSNLGDRLSIVRKEDPEFCVQLAEDKASNAVLQILASKTMRDPAVMRRFVSDQAFQRIQGGYSTYQTAYNRLFLNKVTLSSVNLEAARISASFAITMTSQRVILDESGQKKSVRILDPLLRQEDSVLVMERDRTPGEEAKGSVYMHQCSHCGAPIQNSLEINCSYCGQALNSGTHEWVVRDLLSPGEYRQSVQSAPKPQKRVEIDPTVFDRLYDVRDYAMNNLMVMIAADGEFADGERQYAQALAQKLGYRVGDMDALFQMAASGRLKLRMPDNVGKRGKIIDMMKEVAAVDGEVSPKEQAVLEYMDKAFLSGESFRF